MSSVNNQELQYWVAFNKIPEIGSVRFEKIINYFSSLKQAWESSNSELIQAGLEENIAEKLLTAKQAIIPEQELEKVLKLNLEILTIKDSAYPKLLKEISNPPPLLYYKGELFSTKDEFSMSVVGTRKISAYGRQVTQDLVRELTQNGLVIVSGLALGIDALAHKTCVEANGRTIAVLGNGLDTIYPPANYNLAQKIIDSNGLIVSEFPLGTPSYKSNFPHRNRIISGLSLGTLIIEAGEKSGSLITAKHALEQNREVFAVPGSIYSMVSKGPNQLIKQGAVLAINASDILKSLNLEQAPEFKESREILAETKEEEQIIELLKSSSKHIDDIIKATKLDAPSINSILVTMELKGKVRNMGGMVYNLAR